MPKLIITDGPDAGRTFDLVGEEVLVGRGDGCHLQTTDLTVSRQHFRLVPDGAGWRLLDLGSRNRTAVNAEPVTDHSLRDGDHIHVGSTRFLYVDDEVPDGPGALDLLPPGFENVTVELTGLGRMPVAGVDHLGGLYRFAEAAAGAERLDQLYPTLARVARAECGADRAFLYILDRTRALVAAASEVADPRDDRVAVSRTVVDKVLREGKSVLSADTYGDLRLRGQASIVDNTIRSVMCAPVVSRGRVIGLLYVDIRRGGRAFADADLKFLTAVGQQAGIAIDNLTLREALVEENALLRDQVWSRHDLIGESAAMQVVLHFVAKVAPTDSTVMLNGESGTGKELVAHAIHRSSRRASGPFVAVNCAALTETLLESELFGHEKGAFTGATGQKKGRFEMADGGTLFLDEVGELSLSCQTRFLRVLEESRFERVGGTRSITVDVRVVAATNRDLSQMVADGGFRADLFYRLQVIQIELPPLRARLEDVPLIARHFVRRYAERMGRRIEGIAPDALAALRRYPWPGNVRELKNAIERAVVMGDGPLLRAEDLPPNVASLAAGEGGAAGPARRPELDPAVPAMSLRELERRAIVAAMAETGGNKLRAAALLEIDRSTLYKKLRDYGIEP